MNKQKIGSLIAGLLAVLFAAGVLNSCASSGGSTAKKFKIFSPYLALSTAEVTALGADGLTGSAEAIAGAILAWQDSHMKFVDPTVKTDVSHPMRWNYIMPGIYPVSEMIAERKMSDGGTDKIYGVCWDCAAIFSAIAGYYGLETRVTAWKKYMSGVPGGEKGLSSTEYAALKIKLQKNGLDFSLDQINAAARETWIHYRAEVKIDGAWKAFDGTKPTGDYTVEANYQVAPWDEGYNTDLCQR
jgi:hypothetical protein